MKQTITNRVFVKILIIIFPILFISGSAWIYTLNKNAQTEINNIKNEFMQEKKDELKNYVDAAYDTVLKTRKLRLQRVKNNIRENVRLASKLMHNLYNQYHDKMSENELKKMISDSLRGLNFLEGRGYYFISQMDGTSVMHGKIKKIEKQNNYKSKLRGAVEVHEAILKTLSNSSEGFAEYNWYKSNDTDAKLSKKISYVMYFEPFDWYFGSGDYIENIDAELQKNLLSMLDKKMQEKGEGFFIGDDKGTLFLHSNKKLIGKNILELKDKNGFEYVKDIIKKVKVGENGKYFKYFPTFKNSEVIGYLMYIKDWHWILGSSSELGFLNNKIQDRQEALRTSLSHVVTFLIIVFLLAAILVYILARNFRKNIEKSFSRFEAFFKKASQENIELDVDSMEYLEFEKLALHTNNLVSQIKDLNKKLEAKVELKTKELNTTSEKLKHTELLMIENEKMAALGELVAGVSHEINTPVGLSLTGITHFVHISKNLKKLYENDNMSQDEFEEFIKTTNELADAITINLKRAAEIIKSFKKVAVDQTSREKREFKLKEYIDEILLSLRNKTKKMNIDFDVECDSELAIESYPGSISQIMTNLIMNSMIHGFEDKKDGQIKIKAFKEENQLHIEYSDNGKGIPKESLDKIFKPFYTTKKSKGGSGLGLNIIQKIITDELKGTIECKSTEGESTTFNVVFPIKN